MLFVLDQAGKVFHTKFEIYIMLSVKMNPALRLRTFRAFLRSFLLVSLSQAEKGNSQFSRYRASSIHSAPSIAGVEGGEEDEGSRAQWNLQIRR